MASTQEWETRIEELEQQLERKSGVLNQIIGIINQMNNLLGVMKGHAQLADEDQTEEANRELVRVVLSSTSKAQQLIKNTLSSYAFSEKAQPGTENPKPGKANILVVDDEKLMSSLLYRLLTKQGHNVKVANSGKAAIEACKQESFDIIFMDIILGDMNGVDVFREIRSTQSAPHLVFFSGDPSIKDVQRLVRQEGADGFIRKPFDINEIEGLVKYILSKRASLAGQAS